MSIGEPAEETISKPEDRSACPVWRTEQNQNKEQGAESQACGTLLSMPKYTQWETGIMGNTHTQTGNREKKKSIENIWKNNGQNFPNFMKNNLYIVEAQQTPRRINSN